MDRATFFEHFELLADQPDAVSKMRELVFELAAEGKLLGGNGGPVPKTSLGECTQFIMGQAPPGNECNESGEGTVFVKAGEFGSLYAEVKCWTTKPLRFAKKGDVLICVVGATVGKLNLAIDCAIGRSVAALRPTKELRTKFLYYSLMPFVLRLRNSSRGSAYGVIGKDDLAKVRIWKPETEVQDKVVAKVEELMALCGELEQRQQARHDTRQRLTQAALHHLTGAKDPAEFRKYSSLVTRHSSLLFDDVPQLRQAILQLAVQGRLGTGMTTKKQKLGSVIELVSGQHLIPSEYNTGRKGIPYLTGPADFGPKYPTAKRWTETPKVVARKGDILLTVKGAGVGKTNVVQYDRMAISRQLMAVRSKIADSGFLELTLRSAFDAFQAASNGIAIPGISREDVLNYEVWLPSLAEQKRIVARVEELMRLCDALEAQLSQSRTLGAHLLDSTLHHLLAA